MKHSILLLILILSLSHSFQIEEQENEDHSWWWFNRFKLDKIRPGTFNFTVNPNSLLNPFTDPPSLNEESEEFLGNLLCSRFG